jgi:hypothetical protein
MPMTRALVVLLFFALFPTLQGPAQDIITLPKPHPQRVLSFEEALNRVRTDRTYSPRPLRIGICPLSSGPQVGADLTRTP